MEGGRGGVAVLAAQQALRLSVGQAEEVPPVAGDDDVGSLARSLPGGVAGVLSLAGTVCRAAVVLQQEGGGPAPGGQLEGGGGRGRGAVEPGQGGVGGEDVAARQGTGRV